MTDEQKEELLRELASAANWLAGACFDRRIPQDTRDAMREKSDEIIKVVDKYVD